MRSFCQGQLTKDHTCGQNKQINKAPTPEVRFFELAASGKSVSSAAPQRRRWERLLPGFWFVLDKSEGPRRIGGQLWVGCRGNVVAGYLRWLPGELEWGLGCCWRNSGDRSDCRKRAVWHFCARRVALSVSRSECCWRPAGSAVGRQQGRLPLLSPSDFKRHMPSN